MRRGVRWYLVGSLVLVALIALAGCSHYLLAEREPWRHDAEVACLNSGAVQDAPGRVQISAIEGPGACGIDYPLRVSELGESTPESAPLSYDDEAPIPPGCDSRRIAAADLYAADFDAADFCAADSARRAARDPVKRAAAATAATAAAAAGRGAHPIRRRLIRRRNRTTRRNPPRQ